MRVQQTGNYHLALSDAMINEALLDVEKVLDEKGRTLADFPNMRVAVPLPEHAGTALRQHRVDDEVLQYDRPTLAQQVTRDLPKLNVGQRAAWDAVVAALDDQTQQVMHTAPAWLHRCCHAALLAIVT